MSKEAVIAWTTFEAERLLERGLRANCVSAAATQAAIRENFRRAYGAMATPNLARIGRPGTIEDCAPVIASLADAESAWLKGGDI